ncbi:Protease IV [Mucinivorans hirudinis]|uniref:Protease IV n=1 Tax=Mucinivorans hirudinis TaxID=1433126 RepID=A0A060R871_9BACT|nr:Protease IV [Mucinivorans hirudinis]
MNNFVKSFLACLLAIFVSSVLNILFWIILIFVVIGGTISNYEKISLKPRTILEIDLSASLPDKTSSNPLDEINFSTFKIKKSITLWDAVSLIKNAKDDPNIEGIYLSAGTGMQTPVSSLYELREALDDFRQSGKYVIAYADTYTQGSYFVASVADKVYLNPQGSFNWNGMSSTAIFVKGTLDKLGIEPEIIRYGKFKGAIEPLILTKLSDENRLQTESMLASMWGYVVEKVSQSREIPTEKLQEYASTLAIAFPADALRLGLVDELKYSDELSQELARMCDEDEPRLITLNQYKSVAPLAGSGDILSGDKVALLYAQGEIYDEGDKNKMIIGNELADELRELRKDENVKAVVVRVNSPGGSVLASDIIWREMLLMQQTKPLIISMGEYAASGGYYISCPADVIFAAPTTLTGSIGVFGVLLNVEKGAREKLGITTDIVRTNPMADAGNIFRPLTAFERAKMQTGVDSTYNRFVELVASGRDMSFAQVDDIAQGRVWSGLQGVENGLVDKVGTLKDAIAEAASRAALTSYRIETFPKTEDSFGSLFSTMLSSGAKLAGGLIGIKEQIETETEQFVRQNQGVKAKMETKLVVGF